MNGGVLKVGTDAKGAPAGMLTVDDLNVDGGGTVAMRIPPVHPYHGRQRHPL